MSEVNTNFDWDNSYNENSCPCYSGKFSFKKKVKNFFFLKAENGSNF